MFRNYLEILCMLDYSKKLTGAEWNLPFSKYSVYYSTSEQVDLRQTVVRHGGVSREGRGYAVVGYVA